MLVDCCFFVYSSLDQSVLILSAIFMKINLQQNKIAEIKHFGHVDQTYRRKRWIFKIWLWYLTPLSTIFQLYPSRHINVVSTLKQR
jgi:hypothetical protein